MADAEQVATDLQSKVGNVRNVTVRRIEAGAIAQFVDAIGDPNPEYRDPELARAGKWGGIIAPPTFLGTIRGSAELDDIPFGSTTLNGGETYEFFLPVRVGDVITAVETLDGVRATSGRQGEMLIITSTTNYYNAHSTVVGRRTSVVIKR